MESLPSARKPPLYWRYSTILSPSAIVAAFLSRYKTLSPAAADTLRVKWSALELRQDPNGGSKLSLG